MTIAESTLIFLLLFAPACLSRFTAASVDFPKDFLVRESGVRSEAEPPGAQTS